MYIYIPTKRVLFFMWCSYRFLTQSKKRIYSYTINIALMRHIYDIIREFFIYISYAYHIYHIYKKIFLCTHNLYDICMYYIRTPKQGSGHDSRIYIIINIYIYILSNSPTIVSSYQIV